MKNGVKNDISKPGLTPNLPEWADEVINKNAVGIILETAHPAKFGSIVTEATGREPAVPETLQAVMNLPDMAIPIENNYETFKEWLKANLSK